MVRWFEDGWKHPGKTYDLEAVYYIYTGGPNSPQHVFDNRDYLYVAVEPSRLTVNLFSVKGKERDADVFYICLVER